MHGRERRLLGGMLLGVLITLTLATVVIGEDREVVRITDRLEPATLTVPVGTIVTWRNADGQRHRIRSRTGPVEFDSGNLEPRERFSVTFVVPGEYPYLDERNDDDAAYFGTITVIDAEPRDGPPPSSTTITLIDESFQPPDREVAAGGTVAWENIDGDDDHTVTSTEGIFDSGILPAGSTFEHNFDEPGAYPFFCAIHPEMRGTITVVGEAPDQTIPAHSEDPVPAPGETDPTAGAVSIVGVAFDPAMTMVDLGDTVTWTNLDPFAHTVTARDGGFDSGIVDENGVFSFTFQTAGDHAYFCAIHPSMTGTISVGRPPDG